MMFRNLMIFLCTLLGGILFGGVAAIGVAELTYMLSVEMMLAGVVGTGVGLLLGLCVGSWFFGKIT